MTQSNSPLPRKKILIVDTNLENNAVLESCFSSRNEFTVIGVFQSPQLALSSPLDEAPDLALIGIDIPNGINYCKMLRKQSPAIMIIALISSLDANVESSLRQSGAIECLIRGAGHDQIERAIQTANSVRDSALCSIIGIGGIKEGIGTTLQTAIMGDFIGRKLHGKVLLLDLDFHNADLCFSLGVPNHRSLQDLLDNDNFLDFGVLQGFIVKSDRGFSIIPTAQDRGPQYVSDIAIVSLITVLGNFFEVILIDLPAYPFTGLSGVTDICDRVIINTGETLNHLKSVIWAATTEFKTIPDNLMKKLLFTSWCENPDIKGEIARHLPLCHFLPKPAEIIFNDPAFTINDSNKFSELRAALSTLLESVPSLSLIDTDALAVSPSTWFAKLSNYLRGK
ncbi:MAG: hypothetical protein ACD_39C01847G0002 [uncultured bacterium]|nr:MAG: hypothetical protein ACD_39C01847G0002 [uncultured bacterium]